MKPLLILFRIIIVGFLWSIFFMESTRVIMLRNWHFDILNREHWKIAWDLWSTTWVISEPKEWAFVLIVVSFIPLWFTGWIALSLISWGKFIKFVITLPWRIIKNIFYRPVKVIAPQMEITPVTKRPSYKEIRPKSIRPVQPYNNQPAAAPQNLILTPAVPQSTAVAPTPVVHSSTQANTTSSSAFDHPLFNFNASEEADDFDIDSFDVTPRKNKPAEKRYEEQDEENEEGFEEPVRPTYVPNKNRQDNYRRDNSDRYSRNNRNGENSYSRNNRNEDNSYSRNNRNEDNSYSRNNRNEDNSYSRNNRNNRDYNKNNREQNRSYVAKSADSCTDIIKEKGFALFSRLSIRNTIIDHLAISANRIYLCMLDREPGDWLADEERFNDEEPLWFSENSHRISPVRKLEMAKQIIENRLAEAELEYTVEPILIEQLGNIINAEDMFEIWDDMNIKVCRIDRGMPKELPQFSRTLPDAGKTISSGKLDRLINVIRNIG